MSIMRADPNAVFQALADSSRRYLLDRLRDQNGQTLGELAEGLAMSRQAVTKHLVILEAAQLIVAIRNGREKRHYLNPVPLVEVLNRWLRDYDRVRAEAMLELKRSLEAEHER